MSYEYNEKAHYVAHRKHEELITGKDLTQLEIIVRDDNKNSVSFSLKLPDSICDLNIFRYLKDGDFYDAGGFQSAYDF